MKIVFNTSPLIFLTRLNLLETFLQTPAEFYAPPAVLTEILAKQDPVSQTLQPILSTQIQLTPVPNPTLADSLNQRLGRGESEAIALAIALNADYTILDDFAARRTAQRLGLNIKGTLAILKKLNQDQKFPITSLDNLYQQISTIGFRVKRSVFDDIFQD
jgi:predicted nucleic acid-binding protein